MNSGKTVKFRLYVAGDTPNSALARANLTALCQKYLLERHEIEIVDVFREPKRGLADGVFMTPTLLKIEPEPTRKIVGNLSQTAIVLQTLGFENANR